MMAAPPPKRRLSTEQRRALAMLADAGRSGVTGAIMSANGFRTCTLARLDREGLATAMIAERLKNGGKTIEVVRFRITAAGRRALES
jgi:sulfite reductase beta subunit-like hemoprotein